MADKNSISQRLASLPREQRERLLKLLEAKAKTIQPRNHEERAPLTYSQQRLWIVDQMADQNSAYNETNFIPLPYALDVDIFRRAVNEVVRRHESLRSVVKVIDDEPYQQIMPSLVLEIPLVDLRQLAPEAREQEALRLAVEQGRVPVNLETGPLLRASLYRLDAENFLFTLMMHHIICDGWSMGVFAVELSALYWSFVMGQPSPFPELKIQYPDFAVWQRRAINDQTLASQLAYWRTQLADLPTLDLPTDHPRPAEFSYRGARCQMVIGTPLYRQVSSLCEREDVTLQMMLLAALYVLLHRYSEQDDLPIGSPVAGRTREELQPLIGFFVNMLVLRADLSGDPPFLDLLARVRQISLAAYSNQDVPFERLVDELQTTRDLSRNPLVQVVFQFYQPPLAADFDPESIFPFKTVESATAKFDLAFHLHWGKDELKGYVEYSTDLFDAARMERLTAHFTRLLESIIANPEQPISRLALLTEAEERRLLVEWNETFAKYPKDSSIAAVFEAQARSTPDQTAVVFEDASLTYRELNERADHVASKLLILGIERGAPVGLLMERSLELAIALLGIAKSGAICVPLDPNYPTERLSYLISDSGTKMIVTTSHLRDGLAELGAKTMLIEEALPTEERITKPLFEISPADTACLLYTSGTTGKPKGVAVTHGGVLRLVKGVSYVNFSSDDAVLQFASITFDAATFEIWGCLLNGAKLVIHPPGMPSLDELGAFIKKAGITFLFLTTSLLRQMMERNAADLKAVRQLTTGGEAMPVALAKALWKELPRARIVNMYGPTECTTVATSYTITNAEALGDSVPIGKPIENTSIFILDKYGNPVPVGVPGEIYIGGDGVCQGYWNRPELTALSFVPDPFGGTPGGKLYRTGDIGKYREDGNILFMGRRDRQIKLSGYRIELAEVEAAIASQPAVSGVAVILAVDGDKRLSAFIELLPDQRLTLVELREYLSERLPYYMVPAQLEILDKLPLTTSGKVNYQGLARPEDSTASTTQNGHVAPRTAIEKQLAGIWKQILYAESIGVTDDFFDLGGQSLVATRLLSRVREMFQAEVTMRQFFDNPTIAGLASILSQDERQVKRAELLLALDGFRQEQTDFTTLPADTTS